MNRTINELVQICEKNRLAEKLLFVPSHSVGHQIGQGLAKSGTPWVNLRATTSAAFAAETAFVELSRRGIRFIDSDERLAVVEDLCRSNAFWKSGVRYFGKASEVAGLVKALSNAIHEVRMAGLGSKTIDPSTFLVAEKGQELIALLKTYEAVLEEKKLIDHAGLLSIASALVTARPKKDRMVMVLSDYPVTFLERKLIQSVAGDHLIIIGHDQPFGAMQPFAFFKLEKQDCRPIPKPVTDVDLLKYILDPESAPIPFGDGTVTLFHALGESNEVREVFRRILTSGVPLDDVEVVIPTADPYGALIRHVAISLGLPVTFASGVPLSMTRPGCALLIYLKWQVEDCAERHLRHLLAAGYIDLKGFEDEPPLSPRQAAAFLREAQIGWGRERYGLRLASLAATYAASAEEWRDQGEDQRASWAEETGKKIKWLQKWIERTMDTIPRVDESSGTVDRALFYDGCLSFIQKNCRIASDLDAAARSRVVELLQSLNRGPSMLDPLAGLTMRLSDAIGSAAVGYSGPQPGALHVADYRSAGWSGRKVTFVMGLDQARFPGPPLQDPIILDEERVLLGPEMKPSVDVAKEKVYLMAKLLASIGGCVTISYPCRDLLDDQELMPSSLVLSAFRLISGRPHADYSELTTYLGEPAGFKPKEGSSALNGWEWWLSLHRDGGYTHDSVLDCYPELARGMSAREERTTETMTLYDGHVPSAKGVLNPFEKQKMFSASQLENLATCPFRFFMTYLLHIEPLEDLEKDPNQWLQGAPRGTLLHDVFRRFMEHLVELGERPNWRTHWACLKDLAMELIEEWKEVIPPPSAFSYDREVREILQTCETFLRDEEERCRTIEPCFFELSFGVKNEDGRPAYEAVEIPIRGKGSFLLRGRIDRVDRCGDHIYEVWDYKTGSSYGYKESDYYKKGRQIQHVLYSMAAESLLRQHYDRKASVVRGGYYFPGPKGEGLRIERDETRRGEALRILDQLFSLITTGVFPSAYDTGPCSFCLYSPACGGGAKAVSRCQKLLAGSETLLEPLRRILDND